MKKLLMTFFMLLILTWGGQAMPNAFIRKQSNAFLWIVSSKELHLHSTYDIEAEKLRLYDHTHQLVVIASTEKKEGMIIVTLKTSLDFNRNYYLKLGEEAIWAYFSREVLTKDFVYELTDLGSRFKKDEVTFKFWSPPSIEVKLNLYKKDALTKVFEKKMTRREKGVWYTKVTPHMAGVTTLEGLYYTYEVSSYGQNHSVLDPYALSLSAFSPYNKSGEKFPKAALIDQNKLPQGKTKSPSKGGDCDFIGYEVHVRDFSIDTSSEVPLPLRGTYEGLKTQVPYFAKLGITHLQLMPIQNFFTVDEMDKSFQGENIPSDRINYNWGYDPHHYFALEGWYSTNPQNPYQAINEFASLVEIIHKHKMGVIVDVVYNHIYEYSNLEESAPGCYLRRDTLGNVSFHTGAGPSLESRNPMTRKLIIESLSYFQKVLGVDGFRFDLMNFLDNETMLQIRGHLGENTILYGEAWNFTDLPAHLATTKNNLPKEANLAAFNDSARDAYTGRMQAEGYIQGIQHEAYNVRAGIIGALEKSLYIDDFINSDSYIRFARSPSENINYLSIHDGFTLWDKINLSSWGDIHYKKSLIKNALGLLLTSQGKVIIEGGTEMGRTKPLASNDPNPHRAHTSERVIPYNGVSFFHENTYKSPDISNKIDWDRAKEFFDIKDYMSGLIRLRRSINALRFNDATSISKGLRFIYGNSHCADQKRMVKDRNIKELNIESLILKFINAPESIRGKTAYLAGEMHSSETSPDPSKNPTNNPFKIIFDNNGIGERAFNRKEIDKFDLSAWGDESKLQFKIIKTPGQWDYPRESYTDFGHNAVVMGQIDENGDVVIDLSIVDHGTDNGTGIPSAQIVYLLDNTLENSYHSSYRPLNYKQILVIHNVSGDQYSFDLNLIQGDGKWDILVDSQQSGTVPILESTARIIGNIVTVLAHSTTVMAR